MCSKSIKTDTVFTNIETNHEYDVNFHQNTRWVEKNSETEAVFTKKEMNNEKKMLVFFKIVSWVFNTLDPLSFSFVKAPLNPPVFVRHEIAVSAYLLYYIYLPTSPLRQDMTQGHF